ncbi:hypothetical protein AYO20_11485 [Fonsecaea nubica]|uniref:Uncharacterized protein n=1 Tax=Fonsecaea nubica TaxID=856822 RepID=A0A178BT36_9EURO|nr:hypothetical protein AYO20_11485 [Fonsecaea nubica]OAL20778.1 hypothetical protein AYO20_11485 [Fonsecaea nubica]
MAETCEHKPVIGCALTAVPGCCACADKRPLATAYPLYIDGQGMRLQGKRWQRYCWKCRDYWDLHTQSEIHLSFSSNLPTPHAAVPPDQTPVSPGDGMDLPRNNPFSLSNSQQQSWSFDGVNDGQSPTAEGLPLYASGPSYTPAGTSQSTTAMTSRDFDINGALHYMAQARQNRRPRPNHDIQPGERHPHPRAQRTLARPRNEPGESRPSTQRRQRAVTNPFGTREEIESESYQSPITAMFGRAWNRYRQAEEQRSSLENESIGVQETRGEVAPGILGSGPPRTGNSMRQVDAIWNYMRRQDDQQLFETFRESLQLRDAPGREQDNPHTHPPANPIDSQPQRPRALHPEEMTVNIACRICCEQMVDTLLEPCGDVPFAVVQLHVPGEYIWVETPEPDQGVVSALE